MYKLPKSYRVQDGCHNCLFLYEHRERLESGIELTFYCDLKRLRPPDGVEITEILSSTGGGTRSRWENMVDNFKRWAMGRQVHLVGKCSKWEEDDGTRDQKKVKESFRRRKRRDISHDQQ